MASLFPADLDAFTNPTQYDQATSVAVPHHQQHADLNDAVEALEAKVGKNSSADTNSLDYKVNTGSLPNGVVLSKRLSTAVATLTDNTIIATDASLANHYRVTVGGSRTLANPTNPDDGARIVWEFIQDGTGGRTITLDTKFAFGTDITAVTLSTAGNKRDFMTAVYNQ